MKTITCDRCGKDIPYRPPYMNCATQGIIKPSVRMTVFDPAVQCVKEVDLCDDCQMEIYDYVFDYGNGNGA